MKNKKKEAIMQILSGLGLAMFYAGIFVYALVK